MAAVAVLFLVTSACAAQRVGPEGRVRVICVGDVNSGPGGQNTYCVINYDPAIQATFIPSREDMLVGGRENAIRNMRIYMPRTRENLVDSYELMMLSDADDDVFRYEWISWMSESVRSSGMGLLFLGSIAYRGATDFDWTITTLDSVLPVTKDPSSLFLNGLFYVRIVDRDEALMEALPWEKSPPLTNVNNQVPKDGSIRWAELDSVGARNPLMTFWEVGEGAVLNFATAFPAGTRPWFDTWDLFPQAMMYMVYRVAEKTLPADPYIFVEVMNEFMEYSTMNSLLVSMLDWVEKFGGNPRRLRDRLESVGDIKEDAEEAYLEGSFEEALAIMGDARAEHLLIMDDVNRAKDDALFWVYVTEWCALLGTLLISNYVLWTLMVRRTMYREVGVSRL